MEELDVELCKTPVYVQLILQLNVDSSLKGNSITEREIL